LDNDGRPDLLIVNGHVYPEVDSAKLGSAFREPRFLYWNAGAGKFKDLSKQSGPGLAEPLSGRGLAIADLWNDGRASAVVNNLDDVPMLLVNEAANHNYWLGLQLVGTKSNRDAIGARVTVRAADRSWVDEVRSGSSYSSSSDLRLHFGLGSASRVDSVLVRWPNGESETFVGPAIDGIRELREGSGKAVAH
jgi:enediyne biosynthesis protein E4